MNLPENLQWSTEKSIKKLRPNATFILASTRLENWSDTSGAQPPTWDEIQSQVAIDQALADEWIAQQKEAEWQAIQNNLNP